jgi:hypothetical protein
MASKNLQVGWVSRAEGITEDEWKLIADVLVNSMALDPWVNLWQRTSKSIWRRTNNRLSSITAQWRLATT